MYISISVFIVGFVSRMNFLKHFKGICLGVLFLFVSVGAYAITVSDFDEFVAFSTTPQVGGFDIELGGPIVSTANMPIDNPIISSGTIKGNGNILDGDNLWEGLSFNATLLTEKEYNIYFFGDITFTKFLKGSTADGYAAQGGAIFASGVAALGGAKNLSNGITKIDFIFGTINMTSNTLITVDDGTAVQGGGIFLAGVVSAVSYYTGMNTSSNGTGIINFSSSIVNITSNTLIAEDKGTVAQGGGIFAAGVVSVANIVGFNRNSSSGGTVKINFSSSTLYISSNTLRAGIDGTAAQGGGIFAAGAISAGSYGSGETNSSSGTVIINFLSSIVNITNNTLIADSVIPIQGGTVVQGGGIFVAGAVSAGNYDGIAISSSGAGTINFSSSNVSITSNTLITGDKGTVAQGGGIFAAGVVSAGGSGSNGGSPMNNSSSGTVKINFSSSTLYIASNTLIAGPQGTVAQGGGIFAAGAVSAGSHNRGINISSSGAVTINFLSSDVSITSNTLITDIYGTAAQGGGIFAAGAVSVGNAVGSSRNSSSSGTVTISFSSSTLYVASNVLRSGDEGTVAQGGGIFAAGVVATGNGGGTTVNNNSSNGIVIINFSSSTINITSNTLRSGDNSTVAQGGGIFVAGAISAGSYGNGATNSSSSGAVTINFSSSIVNIASNTLIAGNTTTATHGGGIFVAGAVSAGTRINGAKNISSSGTANIEMIGSSITIGYNQAAQGGAMFIAGSVFAADAYARSTAEYGIAKVRIENSTAVFIGNIATSSGGAIYIAENDGARATNGKAYLEFINSSVSFINNSADQSGGAIYATQGSSIIFRATNEDSYILFENNMVGTNANDIEMQDANLIFDSNANRTVVLNNALITGTGNIEKKGVGNLELKGNINFSPDFKINEGVIMATAAVFEKVLIGTNGKYSMLNGVRIDSMTVNNLTINGTLAIDVSFGIDFLNSWSDIVIANGVTIIGGKLELNVLQETDIQMSSVAVIYANVISGNFLPTRVGENFYTFEWLSQSGTIGANSYDNIGYLVFRGLLPPNPLTDIAQGHNETEVAQSIIGESGLEDLSDIIEGLNDDNQEQIALKQLSGAFLINAITAAARPIGIENLYEHIRANDARESMFWAEVYGQGYTIKEDENVIGEFKEEGYGARIGFNVNENSDDMLGFYIRYGKDDLKQAKDSATRIDAELGVYGGIFKYEKIRLKGILSFGVQQFDVERVIDVGAETPALDAKSEFNTQSIKIAGQVEYIIETKTVREIEVKPFIGFQGGYVHSGEILEEGAGEANLKVAEHNYLQAETLLGIGIGNKNINMSERAKRVITGFIPTFLWNAKVYGGYLITDETPEYEISFRASEGKKMKIWGTDKGKIRAGLALNGEYLISEQVSVYSNLDASFGEKSLGYYANVGVSYKFAKGQAKEKAKPVQKPAPIEVKQEEAQARRQNPQMESFKLEVANFNLNSFELTEESKDPIKEIVNRIKAHEYKKITVEGHTDITGNQKYNIILSQKRAKAVADEFIKNGIDPNKIESVGFGPKIPTADNATAEGRAQNRRVEIFVE